MKKRLLITVIILTAMTVLLSSCGVSFDPRDFAEQNIKITLDDSFGRFEINGYTVCYQSSLVTVYLLKEQFSESFSGDTTLDEYADLVLQANSMTKEVKTIDHYKSFSYEYDVNDYVFHNEVFLYKMSDAFWIVRFECREEVYESLKPSIDQWSSSVVENPK